MKHLKYIATIATGSLLLSSLAPSAFAINLGGYTGNGVNNLIDSATSSLGGDSSMNDDDENVANTDSYSVSTHEIKKGNFSIGNTDTIDISGNLYVYGNLDVSNVDSFKVTGKLKVTGDLIVGNGDLDNMGRIYVGGKKKFSNGQMRGAGAKVTTDFAKYDPILRADLDKEEEGTVQTMIVSMKKKVEALKLEIKAATEKKERIEPIKDKIRHEKEVFFNELKPFIQEEDMAKFEKLMKEDSSATENFLGTFKRQGEPSERLRGQIAAITAKIPAAQREAKLTTLVAKLEAMLATAKLSAKKQLLVSQVKEALQDELDSLAGDDTIDSIINGDTAPATSTGTTQTTGSGTTTSTTSGTGSTQTTGSGTTTSTTSGTGGTTQTTASGSTTSSTTSGTGSTTTTQ